MRFTIHAILMAATIATSPVVAEPTVALTADEKREKARLLDARRATLTRKDAELRNAFVEKCEAAFEAGEPMPEKSFRITGEVTIDDDLVNMTVEGISEQYGIASDLKRASDKAWKACVLKYRQRDTGS